MIPCSLPSWVYCPIFSRFAVLPVKRLLLSWLCCIALPAFFFCCLSYTFFAVAQLFYSLFGISFFLDWGTYFFFFLFFVVVVAFEALKMYVKSFVDAWLQHFGFLYLLTNRGRNPVVVGGAFSDGCQVWQMLPLSLFFTSVMGMYFRFIKMVVFLMTYGASTPRRWLTSSWCCSTCLVFFTTWPLGH